MQLEARVTKSMLQTNVPLSKPAAVCVASDDLLLCAYDGHRVVYQIQLERNGVTINGKLRKLIAYPEGIHHLESIAKSDSSVVYFAAAKKQTNKQTNKHVQINVLVTQVTCTWIYRS